MARKPYVVGVIPCRYAAQRLPAKPLLDLLGKPMVQRVYDQAKKARLVNRVVVATDDIRIENAVKSFGGEVMMTSPDIMSGSDRVAAVARKVKGDIFVNVQGDEPLIDPRMIDEAVRVVLKNKNAVVGTLVKKITTEAELLNPAVVKVAMSRDGKGLYFSRSIIPHVREATEPSKWLNQQAFFKHIGIYVFRKDFLLKFSKMKQTALEQAEKLEQLRILENGYAINVGITKHDSIPVDTQEDADRVVALLQSQNMD
ncbi:MAG: 3-deoxy-manno-octulosonate cytidylyltransferase [Ignavibacteriales bacterium]|nr:3-deoxy-manno-octulosonate cytidylyltransferase [Ignavibacteriales bacterium]